MKILITSPGYPPAYQIGGPVTVVASLAEALVEKNQSVVVFATNCNMNEDLDIQYECPEYMKGVEVWYFKRKEPLKTLFPSITYFSKSMGYLYAPSMLRQLYKKVPEMDLVHVHLPFIYPTFASARVARICQKPLFYHQHGIFDPTRLKFRSLKKKIYLRLIEQPILRSATTLIALTEQESEDYKTLCRDVPCRIIPNGVDVTQYRTEPKSSNILNLHPDAQVVLYLGRLHPLKGVDLLIDAFLEASKYLPDAVLVVAGPDEFKLEKELKLKVMAHGLCERVIFTGLVTGELKIELLARANLFCLPSFSEGFSVAILEALASGTPVLISPGCHFTEVERVKAGKVIEPDSAIMAESIIELLKDKKLLISMGIEGQKFVKDNFSWKIIAEELLDVYREGLDRYVYEKR